MDIRALHEGNRDAWERTALQGYAGGIQRDIELIRQGGTNLMPAEIAVLEGLMPSCERLIHLQCSHGLDTLCLWKLGSQEVVGVDISNAMLEAAQKKSMALGAPAMWVQSDVLDTPDELNETADIVYTGKGALCWMMDIDFWAATVRRLLKPGGRLFLFEGHSLDFVLLKEGPSYFMSRPAPERGFPYNAALRGDPDREVHLTSRIWTVGQVVTACVQVGLQIELLEEHPEPFWDQFKHIPEETLFRLPHTYLLVARKA